MHPHSSSDSIPSVPGAAWERLEPILERFEEGWRQGQRPSLSDYLAEIESGRLVLLIELVNEDLEQRLQLGEGVRIEIYLSTYPELASNALAATDLIAAEFVLREMRGEVPRLEDSQVRFPEQAPILPQRVAVDQARALGRAEPHGDGESVAEAPTLPPAVVAAEAVSVPPVVGPSSEAVSGQAPASQLASASPLAAEWVAVAGYEVLGALGKGGMGVVYKARQIGLDRVVALKMIRYAEDAGPEERERFRTNAQAVARLQHPNIVQIYEVGACQGLPSFSLEFCPGGSLADQLDGTPWEPQRAAWPVESLARAMQAAHAAGVVHRDLKPADVLLTPGGTPRITAFGLAKRLDVQGQTQTAGTAATVRTVVAFFDGRSPSRRCRRAGETLRARRHRQGSRSGHHCIGLFSRSPFHGKQGKPLDHPVRSRTDGRGRRGQKLDHRLRRQDDRQGRAGDKAR
jgi:hypothetical protein